MLSAHGFAHVFCCFIDFSKAFDSVPVDSWLLFCKLPYKHVEATGVTPCLN